MNNGQKNRFRVSSRMKSFVHAWHGIAETVSKQHNFRIHLAATALVVIFGSIIGLSALEWLAITLSIGFVLSLEMVNTAIEYLVDLISPEYRQLAGKAKDVAAGAVLVAATTAMVVGLIVFIPKIIGIFAHG